MLARRSLRVNSIKCISHCSRAVGIRRVLSTTASFSPDDELFEAREDHREYLRAQSQLPNGFKTSVGSFAFNPVELPDLHTSMTMTLIVPDEPTDSFAAMYTSNAIAGHPVHVGRDFLADKSAKLGGIVVNNKISNVGAPGGKQAALEVCDAVARELSLDSDARVLPSSTGVIGWQIPHRKMIDAVPTLVDGLKAGTMLPAAEGIMTTDLYPKLRASSVEGTGARVVGIAKGAGMIEPNLATMLVFVLTDADLPRDALEADLRMAVGTTFNCLSIDQDQSTSDSVIAMSSRKQPCEGEDARRAFQSALLEVCGRLAMDVVRNGEGVQHVIQVAVRGASTRRLAVDVGRSVVNSPLFKTAVAGNDPNVGRLLMAVGKAVGPHPDTPPEFRTGDALASAMTASVGGTTVFEGGKFALSADKERALKEHFLAAQMWSSMPELLRSPVAVRDGQVVDDPMHPAIDGLATGQVSMADDEQPAETPPRWFARAGDLSYKPPVDFPPHQRCVEVEVDLGMEAPGKGGVVLGGDLTFEYVAVNAEYRS